MESAINDRTFMIVGSLPPWSHGVCDPISEIAHVAHRHDLWFHVDACVGGYLAPFMRDLGESVPDFDFSLPGVCSISADLHKYGYGAKGVSLVLYANQDLARFQPFEFDQWASGLYRSATLTGTRSGGAIAASWAVMKFLGRAGYGRRTSQILKAKAALCSAIASDADLRLVGQPELATIAVAAHDIDIYAVAEQLSSRGWAINLLRDPPALQFVIGPLKDEFIEELARDLTQSSERVRRESLTAAVARVVYSDEIPRRQPGTA
jgi:glutamate/tyrosine decarboxylase-like PLP-dependent enzyme